MKKISASVTVGGIGNAVTDRGTPFPQLTVIHAGVNVLGKARYRLLNPNGWYCIIAGVSVLGEVHIDLHRSAQITGARVNVSVQDHEVGVEVGDHGLPGPKVGVEVLGGFIIRRVDY